MPTTLSRIVLDPGHGGTRPVGGSSPNRAHGPNGLLERDVTLDIARRAARLLAAYGDTDVRLTRTDDHNLSLADRARVAHDLGADAFVSLHLNGAPDPSRDGTEVYVARTASPRSTSLARLVGTRVASAAGTSASVARRDLGVLLGDRHAPATSACLVELAYLTNPPQAERLAAERHRESIAAALAQAIHAHVANEPAAPAALADDDYDDGYGDDDPAAVMTLDVYAGSRAHARSADAALFTCAPNPVAVDDATQLPAPAADGDVVTRGALGVLGLTAAEVKRFADAGGLAPMKPIAAACGQDMLVELLRRLRYTTDQIKTPPTSWRDLNAGVGVTREQRILASRVLLAIPGHFRQLARRTTDAVEAHALETLGWLFAYWLRDRVENATKKKWWLPPTPSWVEAFPDPLPHLDSELHRLIMRMGQIDNLMEFDKYRARQRDWATGLAGQQWRREIGAEAGVPAGRPFYPAIVAIPAAPNIAAEMRRIRTRFTQHVTATQNATGVNTNDTTFALHRCRGDLVAAMGLITSMPLGGLELTTSFPLLASQRRRTRTSMEFMTALHPLATALFQTIHDLGWNDLLYNTEGSFCFRGIKREPTEADFHTAATSISDHAFGIAIDVNVAENPARVRHSTIDPRIVAVFEAFHFQWGTCFPRRPDPMHFQFDDAQGQPAAAPAHP